MKYNCPNCGAVEPAVHRNTCSLAGLPVWQEYDPFDWAQALAWLAERLEDFKQKYPGRIVLMDAKSLDYHILDTDKEAFPDNLSLMPFGRAPATGQYLICQKL